MAMDRPDTRLATVSLQLGDHANVTNRSQVWFEFTEPAAALMRRMVDEQARCRDVVATSGGRGPRKIRLPDDHWELAARTILDVALYGKSIPTAYVEVVKGAMALAVSGAFPVVHDHLRYIVSIQRNGEVSSHCVDGENRLVKSKKLGSLSGTTAPTGKTESSKIPYDDNLRKTPLGILFGVLAFVVGFAAVAAIEGALLLLVGAAFDRNLSPRGLGWIVLPVLGGISCATVVPKTRIELRAFGARIRSQVSNMGLFVRRSLAGTIAWFATLGTYYVVFDPFGGYASSEEWNQLLKLMILPPIIGVSTAWCIMQLLRERN